MAALVQDQRCCRKGIGTLLSRSTRPRMRLSNTTAESQCRFVITMTNRRLTPALRRLLGLIGHSGDRGHIKREIDAAGGRARSQLRALLEAGYAEWVLEETDHGYFSDRVRIQRRRQASARRPRSRQTGPLEARRRVASSSVSPTTGSALCAIRRRASAGMRQTNVLQLQAPAQMRPCSTSKTWSESRSMSLLPACRQQMLGRSPPPSRRRSRQPEDCPTVLKNLRKL